MNGIELQVFVGRGHEPFLTYGYQCITKTVYREQCTAVAHTVRLPIGAVFRTEHETAASDRHKPVLEVGHRPKVGVYGKGGNRFPGQGVVRNQNGAALPYNYESIIAECDVEK